MPRHTGLPSDLRYGKFCACGPGPAKGRWMMWRPPSCARSSARCCEPAGRGSLSSGDHRCPSQANRGDMQFNLNWQSPQPTGNKIVRGDNNLNRYGNDFNRRGSQLNRSGHQANRGGHHLNRRKDHLNRNRCWSHLPRRQNQANRNEHHFSRNLLPLSHLGSARPSSRPGFFPNTVALEGTAMNISFVCYLQMDGGALLPSSCCQSAHVHCRQCRALKDVLESQKSWSVAQVGIIFRTQPNPPREPDRRYTPGQTTQGGSMIHGAGEYRCPSPRIQSPSSACRAEVPNSPKSHHTQRRQIKEHK